MQYLSPRRGPDRKSIRLLNVSTDLRNARPGPVRAPQNLVGYVFDSRKVLHQFLRRDAGDMHVHFFLPTNPGKRQVYPTPSAPVRKNGPLIPLILLTPIPKPPSSTPISAPR